MAIAGAPSQLGKWDLDRTQSISGTIHALEILFLRFSDRLGLDDRGAGVRFRAGTRIFTSYRSDRLWGAPNLPGDKTAGTRS
jgi:hypothetical protein